MSEIPEKLKTQLLGLPGDDRAELVYWPVRSLD
jgi:hypothetical protein